MVSASVMFTRENDGTTFTFSNMPPFQLHPDTLLPDVGALDVSGLEYTGLAGGRTLASRFQRQTVKIVFNVLESWMDSRSLMELLAAGRQFFQPMNSDLTVNRFTMTVTTNDGSQSQWMMRHGAVTIPFSAPLVRGRGLSVQNEMDFIFDDPYQYWVSGEGVSTASIIPYSAPGTLIGESWTAGLQTYTTGLSQWIYPTSGGGGVPQTISIVSSVAVNASIQLFGQIANPHIVNSVDGSSWSWTGQIPPRNAMSVSDDGVTVDWLGERQFNAIGQLTAQPGLNTFSLSGTNLDSNAYAVVTVRGAI